MLKKTLTLIQYNTSWLAILLLLATTLLMMFLMNGTQLPFSNPTIMEHSGGLMILDIRESFSPDDAYELFTALGAEGRRAYLILHLVPDTIFPIGYALTFAFVSTWFLVRLLPLAHRLQWLSMIPLISGLADVLENLSLVICNLVYPGRIDWLVRFAHLLTKVKFGLLPIGLVFLIIIVVMWFIRKRPASNVHRAIDQKMGYAPGFALKEYSSKEKKMNEQEIKYQKAKERVTALRGFYGHLSVYVIVNLGLFLINMIMSPEILWFFWPLMGWGIAIVLHAWRVLGGAFGSNWEEKKIAELMEKE